MKHKSTNFIAGLALFSLLFTTISVGQTATKNLSNTLNKKTSLNVQAVSIRDLTLEAQNNQVLPISGIEADMQKITNILQKNARNNPVLLDVFAGKSDVLLGNLALHLLVQSNSPKFSKKQILSLSLPALLANSKDRNQAEDVVSNLLEKIKTSDREVILYVDDPNVLAKNNTYYGNQITEKLRSAVADGDLQIITVAANQADYEDIIKADAELSKHFQKVELNITEAELKHPFVGDKISPDLRKLIVEKSPSKKVRAIVQSSDINDRNYRNQLQRTGVQVIKEVRNLNMLEIEMPLSVAEIVADIPRTKHISMNLEVASLGHLETTTGVAAVRAQPANSHFDGRNIGIAVVDSAIYKYHNSFKDEVGDSRIEKIKEFISGGRQDKFGHGTHVAGIAAGSGGVSDDEESIEQLQDYRGIAPGADLIILRALDNEGRGETINLLEAIDWIYENRLEYNIRVVNLSLGTPAVESWRNDPLCRAVRMLVDAGIVVVAAAGNNGKDSAGNKIYGLIHSPGNDPSVITVGASNSFGTDVRSDDGIATYSSRGPTRSFWTDVNNVKHYDNIVKPDLVAPGNKIISAAAKENNLLSSYPELGFQVPTNDYNYSPEDDHDIEDENRLMQLSGTSMATPVVSGTVALMIQANPSLTPNLIKVILQYSAQPIAGFNMLEQGAGQVNIEGAIRLSKIIRSDLHSEMPLNAPMLVEKLPDSMQNSQIANENVLWSRGVMFEKGFGVGTDFINEYQKVYGLGLLLSDGLLMSDGMLVSDGLLMSDGMIVSDGLLTSDGMIMSDGVPFADMSDMFDETNGLPDEAVFSDGLLMSDGMLVSDGMFISDSVFGSTKILVGGDNPDQTN